MSHKFLRLNITVGLALVFVLLLILSFSSAKLIGANPNILYVAPNADCGVDYVPCYGNLQDAVDAATEGDTIKVASGVYTGVRNIQSLNYEVWGRPFTATQVVAITTTIKLQGGYSSINWDTPNPQENPTVLDAQEQGRVIYIRGAATISGLRLTGGDATGLGGDQWSDDDAGGGLYIAGIGATIQNTEIVSNTAQRGGGIYAKGSAVLQNNQIIGNHATWYGGGVELRYSNSTLINNVIQNNSAYHGAGISTYSSNAMITHNLIQDNIANWSGGGVDIAGGYYEQNPQLINNALLNNYVVDSRGYGSAVSVNFDACPELIHTTIAQNIGGNGSGVSVRSGSCITMTNTIFTSHTIGISATVGTTATVSGILWYGNVLNYGGSGSIEVANEYAGNPDFASDGYHLTNTSAAINRGVNSGITTDIDGQPRPIGNYDLGADEVMPNVVVNQTTGATLIYTDTQGITSEIQVPAGAVSDSTTLVYVPVIDLVAPMGFAFVGRAFDLNAYRGDALVPTMTFNVSVTVVLHYTDSDVVGLDEEKLLLQTWDEETEVWVDAACGEYDRLLAENRLAMPICHLSRFALFAEKVEYKVYLPLALRNP